MAVEKKTPFLVQHKQIFGSSYFDKILVHSCGLFEIFTFCSISEFTRRFCFTISHIPLKIENSLHYFDNFPAKSAFISDGVKISDEETCNHANFGSLKTISTTLIFNKVDKLQVRTKSQIS
jgi:hypothetical protein